MHTGLENRWTVTGTSEPGSVDDNHWKQSRAQREDGWLKCSCLPCFPHILITHYSVILGYEGPRHWNPVVQFLLPTLGNWMTTTCSFIFFLQYSVSLFRAEYSHMPKTSSLIWPVPILHVLNCAKFYWSINNYLSLATSTFFLQYVRETKLYCKILQVLPSSCPETASDACKEKAP